MTSGRAVAMVAHTGPRIALVGVVAVSVVSALIGAGLFAGLAANGALPDNGLGSALFKPLGAVAFAVVGAIVVLRQCVNPVGRLLVLGGIDDPADAYHEREQVEPGIQAGAAVDAWFATTVPMVVLTIIIPRLLVQFANPAGVPRHRNVLN